MDAFDYKNIFFFFYLTVNFCCEVALSGWNLARLQRAPEGTSQSAAGSGHHIIQGSCMGIMDIEVNPIMLCNLRVDTKGHRLGFCR